MIYNLTSMTEVLNVIGGGLAGVEAALAESVLSEDADALAKFGESDIAALLAPLPAPAR